MKAKRLYRNSKACVEGTACVAQCRTHALSVARPDYLVAHREAACTSCGRCVDACAFAALELLGPSGARKGAA